LFQFVTGKGIPHPWNVAISAGRRATGPYPFPNALALFVTPLGVFAMGEWLKRPRAWFALLTSMVCVLGIALAKSDGGAIAFAAAISLMLGMRRWGRRVVASGIGVAVIGLICEPAIRLKVWHVLTFQEWSGKVRLFMWRETWAMLKDHWFFGAGLGGYPTVFDAYHKARFIEIFQYPHTILFNFWTETGLLGALTFLGVIVTWIKRSMNVTTHSKKRIGIIVIALAPLVAIFIHGLVDVPYFKNDLALVFWILAFLSLSDLSVDKTEVRLAGS
jgi:putative inorganic carbon (HCO3(-)) transporter